MPDSNKLPGTPLAQAHDPARFGEGIALLALLAPDRQAPARPTPDGQLPVQDGLALDANRVAGLSGASTGDWERGWESLGRPRAVLIRTFGPEREASEPIELLRPVAVRDGVSLLATVRAALHDQSAAAGSRALVLAAQAGAASSAGAAGVAYSEDPRADRVESIHVDVWPPDAAGDVRPRDSSGDRGGEAVRYRRSRAGGRWTTEIPPGAATMLSSATLESVVSVLRTAEASLGESLALEWRWQPASAGEAGGGIAVLGVAPQRTPLPWAIHRAAPQPHDGWSRANAGEVLAGPVTPMTWSMLGEPLNLGFRAMYPPSWSRGRRYFALFGGYAYFNFGLVYHLVVERMGGPSRAMLDVVGGPGDARALNVPDRGLHWRTVLRALPSIIASTRRQRRLPQRWEREREALTALRADIMRVDPADVDSATIMEVIENIYARQLPHVQFFMEAQGAAFSSYALLRHLLSWFLGEAALANRLVQGLPDVATAETNLRLWRLAERAAADPETAALVARSAPGEMLAALRASALASGPGGWLAAELESFLRAYGHRGAAELELLMPRWGDDPTPVLTSFQSYVAHPERTSVEALVDRQRRAREAAAAEVDARLTARWWDRALPLRRAVVRNYAAWARRYAPLRENPKSAVLAVSHEMRRLLLVLGERLALRGVLREAEDVFFLDRAELATLVTALDSEEALTIGRLRRRVARRRRFYAQALEREPAPMMPAPLAATPSGVHAGEDAGATTVRGEEARVLRGLAASAGVTEGIARLLESPSAGGRLGAGEVLVARFTDPGWTHLFPLAGAVVTEIGGVLSHGALVAREYGLPAVVNVAGATQLIADGARVRVDGSAGTVELLD